MKKNLFSITVPLLLLFITASAWPKPGKALIIDHNHASVSSLTDSSIQNAVKKLKIVYGHTSHGSQVTDGLRGLQSFNKRFLTLPSIVDGSINGARDLGQPDRKAWVKATRDYLQSNPSTNVVIWSWCGQVSWSSENDIKGYLDNMSQLENEFPSVVFVYMTGHLDGTGLKGNLHIRNEQIRAYCRTNGKVLYDFADIESYDPDGREYLSKGANDNCDYDSDGDGKAEKNWAEDWQKINPGKWYNCSCVHSKPLNGNMKAYAAWNLFTGIAERMK